MQGGIGVIEVRGFPVVSASIAPEKVIQNACRKADKFTIDIPYPFVIVFPSSCFASFEIFLVYRFQKHWCQETKLAVLRALLAAKTVRVSTSIRHSSLLGRESGRSPANTPRALQAPRESSAGPN